jgi:hypothetical protein
MQRGKTDIGGDNPCLEAELSASKAAKPQHYCIPQSLDSRRPRMQHLLFRLSADFVT